METMSKRQASKTIREHDGFYTYALFRNDKQEVFYVGKGKGKRALSHLSTAKRIGNHHLRNIVDKVGRENISFIIWPANSEEEAFQKEVEMIAKYKDTVCNHTTGGDGGFSLSEETKEKMRIAKIGYKPNIEAIKEWWTPERRKEHSELQKSLTRNYSDESKKRLAWRKGISDSEETKEKKRKSWTPERRATQAERARKIASKLTEEQKKDKSERMIGNNFHEKVKRKPLSEETKKKIREKLLGRKLPDEVKEKISASSKIIAQKRRRNEDGKFV